jgi:hemerythrin superfamily protein
VPDAIVLLKDDHKAVERLFKEFEKLVRDDAAPSRKRKVVDRIIEELAVHAAIEEQRFYPAVRDRCEELGDTVLEGLEEHHVVKWTLSELEGMDPAHERFDAKVTVLIESVRHHVEEEEGEMFPLVREAMGRKALRELGDQLVEAKRTAPTKPHPKAPDEPPGNLVAGAGAAAADRVVDLTEKAVKGAGRKAKAAAGR